MFKYNIGDVVLYKGRKECIVGRTYIETAGDISIEYELSLKHKNVKTKHNQIWISIISCDLSNFRFVFYRQM